METAIKLIQESIALFNETHSTKGCLRSIIVYGNLLILTNQIDKVIVELNKYTDLTETRGDNRTKMLFYLTYSDAYFANGDFNKALHYCNKAKLYAEELNLEKELNNIYNKEKTIKILLQKS